MADSVVDPRAGSAGAAPGNDGSELVEYLVVFVHHNMYFNMRFQELEALTGLLGLASSREELYVERPLPTALAASPLTRIRLRGGDAAAKSLCERAVLVKAVLEVWACGTSHSEAVAAALGEGDAARAKRRPFLAPPRTFQIRVMAFGRSATLEDKREIIETIKPLFDGDEVADLHDPDTTIWAVEEHDHHTEAKTHLGPRTSVPQRTFVARQVAGGRSLDKKLKSGDKAFFHRYDLSQRAVLGPTTLENELAFIMANCARVRAGQTALEPFCGTGGIMVALSHFGARVTGGEIDIRVVRGWRIAYTKNKTAALDVARSRGLATDAAEEQKASASSSKPGGAEIGGAAAASSGACASGRPSAGGGLSLGYLVGIGLAPPTLLPSAESAGGAPPRPEGGAGEASPSAGPTSAREPGGGEGRDIFTNFVQYGLALPEVVVLDNAVSPWRTVEGGWCDCIVTDPPYGVRAGAKKQGRSPDHRHVEIADLSTYIPSKVNYDEDDLSRDLLTLAASALRDNGRIVFLVPVDLADFLGIDRAASERGGGPRGSLHETSMPKGGRKKDPRLCISETTRDPRLLDESGYLDFLPAHSDLELIGASLQVLSGGLGRLLVTMSRRPRRRAPGGS